MNRSQSGFTLIELVLIVFVVTVLAAVASVALQDFGTIKLSSATRKLASDIEFTRRLATAKQTRSAVTLAATSYSVYEDYGTLNLARDPVGGGNFVVDYTSARYQDFAGVTLSTLLPAGVVKFNSLGSPLRSDDTALPAAEGKITVMLGGNARTLCIEPNTGKVRTLNGNVACA